MCGLRALVRRAWMRRTLVRGALVSRALLRGTLMHRALMHRALVRRALVRRFLYVACGLMGGALRLVELAFGPQLFVSRHLAGRLLDGSLGLIGGAFDVFAVHCVLHTHECSVHARRRTPENKYGSGRNLSRRYCELGRGRKSLHHLHVIARESGRSSNHLIRQGLTG